MPRNGQHPGSRIAARETADPAERAQARLLDHVLRIGRIAREPTRQGIGIGKMRQHDIAKARLIAVCHHALTRAPIPEFVAPCYRDTKLGIKGLLPND